MEALHCVLSGREAESLNVAVASIGRREVSCMLADCMYTMYSCVASVVYGKCVHCCLCGSLPALATISSISLLFLLEVFVVP